MRSPRTRKMLLAGASIGLALGGFLGGSAVAGVLSTGPAEDAPKPEYASNQSGLSYGSAASAVSPETEPDLILVETKDGTTGYVYKTDLDRASGADVKTPDDALVWQNARSGPASIPVYDVDGKTPIGEFIVGELGKIEE